MKMETGRPLPLGVSTNGYVTNFSIQVENDKECKLLLYKEGESVPVQSIMMPPENAVGKVRFVGIADLDPEISSYNYQVDDEIQLDPFTEKLTGTGSFGTERDIQNQLVKSVIMDRIYDWGEDRNPRIPADEVIAYSLHVRGFTKHKSSKVKHKGTFLGVIEKIPYLKELGINQIQCMPVYEFDELVDKKVNYWGYGKGYYFAPKAAYSASGDAATELKDMIKACHKEGIEVVLEMPFFTGVSAQVVIRCLQYYMIEYHVDGFIVNPYIISLDVLRQDAILCGVKILKKEEYFQNTMRRFLKGDEGMVWDVINVLKQNAKDREGFNYITTQTGFTLNDLVSYDQKHNEENGEKNQDGPDYNYSWNCGAEGKSRKKMVVALRKKQIRNAFCLLLFAQGMPCILAGDEFGNTQKGNNNVYCQDNEIAWLDWNGLNKQRELFEYVKQLIAFRKEYKILHQDHELTGFDKTSCGYPDVSYHGESAWQTPAEVYSRQLGVMYCIGKKKKDEEMEQETCYLAYNMHWLPHLFALPSIRGMKWKVLLNTGADEGNDEEDIVSIPEKKRRFIEAAPRSIVLLTAIRGDEET